MTMLDARRGGRHERLPGVALALAGGGVDGGVQAAERDHDDEQQRQHEAEDERAHVAAAGGVLTARARSRPTAAPRRRARALRGAASASRYVADDLEDASACQVAALARAVVDEAGRGSCPGTVPWSACAASTASSCPAWTCLRGRRSSAGRCVRESDAVVVVRAVAGARRGPRAVPAPARCARPCRRSGHGRTRCPVNMAHSMSGVEHQRQDDRVDDDRAVAERGAELPAIEGQDLGPAG